MGCRVGNLEMNIAEDNDSSSCSLGSVAIWNVRLRSLPLSMNNLVGSPSSLLTTAPCSLPSGHLGIEVASTYRSAERCVFHGVLGRRTSCFTREEATGRAAWLDARLAGRTVQIGRRCWSCRRVAAPVHLSFVSINGSTMVVCLCSSLVAL